jgi:pimeloyl-ACP methyl ester carboxylesterase
MGFGAISFTKKSVITRLRVGTKIGGETMLLGLLLTLGVLLLAGCGTHGSGNVVTEDVPVAQFDRVSLTGMGTAIITQGDEAALTIEGEDNLIGHVNAKVVNSTLIIDFPGKEARGAIRPTKPISFHVRVEELAGLELSGLGNIQASLLDSERLEVSVSGGGDVTIDALTAKELLLRLTGLGDAELAGQVKVQRVLINSGGEYRGERLESQNCYVEASGLGDATVWATDALDVRISGGGNVEYYGAPQVAQQVNGLGRLSNGGESPVHTGGSMSVGSSSRPRDGVEQQPARELGIPSGDIILSARAAGNSASGNVLIAVHGGPGMSRDYLVGLEQLSSEGFAVVTYDQRGTGGSTSPAADPENYELSDYVADLDAVRKTVGAEHVHLLGHSWGGLVVMRYATVYPERVRTITLMGSGAPSWAAAQAAQANRAKRIQDLQARGIIPQTLKAPADLIRAYFSDPGFAMPDELKNLHYSPAAEQLTWSALGEYDFTAEVARLEHPVLLLYGEDDPFGIAMAEATKDALSSADAELVLLESCGHFWHECPDAFFAHVRAFLNLEPR